MFSAAFYTMSNSELKLSPRKNSTPKTPTLIANIKAGQTNVTIEARVTSVSVARSFGDGPDSVFLHMSLMDSSGL